jgi:hypothetical protein
MIEIIKRRSEQVGFETATRRMGMPQRPTAPAPIERAK